MSAFVFALASLVGVLAPAPTVAACANPALPPAILDGPAAAASPLPVVRAAAPRHELDLAVAAEEHARELGLMCVLKLRPDHGMIFVFDRDARQEFWMKNTLVPLDMVWVHADGTVDTVAADVPASTRATPDAKVARRFGTGTYVIELAAGEARRDGLARGVRVVLPRLAAAPPG